MTIAEKIRRPRLRVTSGKSHHGPCARAVRTSALLAPVRTARTEKNTVMQCFLSLWAVCTASANRAIFSDALSDARRMFTSSKEVMLLSVSVFVCLLSGLLKKLLIKSLWNFMECLGPNNQMLSDLDPKSGSLEVKRSKSFYNFDQNYRRESRQN